MTVCMIICSYSFDTIFRLYACSLLIVFKRFRFYIIFWFSIQLTASTTNFEQRDFVIRELIDTETNYLEVLNALRYKFMLPMEKLLARDEIRSIFPKIKVSLLSVINFRI